jgi:mRNA-degrading endonuclease RelE of RelBE toxin-antitoxin system
MKHFADPSFWDCYERVPCDIQELASKNFELLKDNPKHPSLHLKKVGQYWSVRVGRKYRALAIEDKENFIWFWIGTHSEYEEIIS